MFKTLINAFKIEQLRKRIFYTFWIILVVRLGCQLPIPGIDAAQVQAYLQSVVGSSYSFIDSFTGGSFLSMSVFALSVTPYITASIIMQLLTIAIPALEEMQRDGEDGRKKMNKITRYVSVGLAIIESAGLSIGFSRQGALTDTSVFTILTIIVTLTAGSCIIMWLGERISDKGIGNGISIILLINIVSRMPNDFSNLYIMFVKGKDIVQSVIAVCIIVAVVIGTTILVIILQDAERRIPVQYSKKVQGRKMAGGQSSYIPLKVNTAGVIPIIFASSLLSVPSIIINLFNMNVGTTAQKIMQGLNQNYWFNAEYPWASVGLIIYIVLNIIFAYFYTSITFNPMEVANNMKKSGGFIPGIRPGKATQDYLNKILNYIVLIGVIGLLIVALIPIFFNGAFKADVSFGGTSLIIIVGVILETMKQLESQMLVRNYSGFLNN
ncbi:MAG: preprotein translocase subunit SecY [Lachnospiraceae bacterium]|nr:preprotein translocase subunit SecY [Lachnospiraceae bacterium]HCJ07943.1 preprotein translocase subunit SecY [Lachnospiraceae bacterium]